MTAKRTTVAFLGPAGTYSHLAARTAFPDARHLESPTVGAVLEQVAHRAADIGVLPIENSTEGSVTSALDALIESALSIRGELVIDIALCLLATHDDRSTLKRVASHPQPLAQCQKWLLRELPNAVPSATASTAAAALAALADPETAAVAGHLAAELHGLTIVADNIQDRPDNATRFVVVGHDDAARTGRDKTTIVFSTRHERGALRRALEIFDDEALNLTRIESRPAPGKRWEYVFLSDLEGHRDDPAVARALARLTDECGQVRILGSYPRATESTNS